MLTRYRPAACDGAGRGGLKLSANSRAGKIWLTFIPLHINTGGSTRTSRPPGPVVLIVLDGWGFRPGREGNAIELGSTPVWHRLWERAPRTLLEASGLAVGLPEGQIGNSEVGHLNLGAGRVVPQDLVRISQSIADKSFFENRVFTEIIGRAVAEKKSVHLVGLIGSGGVHAIDAHLLALVELCKRMGTQPALHAMLDGRDTMPRSGLDFMHG